MSENDDTIQVPQPLTFEPLGYLADQPPTDDPDEPQQLETYANELTTNIIKDASQTAGRNHDENFDNTEMDNTNELNFPQTSKQNQSENTTTTALDKSEYSTSNELHDESGFDNEDIQNKMSGVIQDIQSRSGNDKNLSRKAVTSNHLHDNQINNSSSTIIDPLSNNPNDDPIQSVSESTTVDHHVSNEQSLPLPIRQNESSSDADEFFGIKTGPTNTSANTDDSIDQHRSEQENTKNNRLDDNDEFFNTKVATIDDDQRPTSASKQNALDETTRFGTTSSSRVQSASSKRSVHVTPDEQSTSSDEKRTEINQSKLPDDTGNDTDRDNQEVAIIARRPSRALSPLNRPRSPTPNDSVEISTNNEPLSSTFLAEQSQSPTDLIQDDDNQQKQIYEPSSASRRESTNKDDQQQISQLTSVIKTKFDDNSFEPSTSRASSSRTHQFITTDEQSKLIKPGEQLQIPTDDFDGERLNSPPSLSTGIKSLALINPLLGSSLVQHEQDQSQLSSETDRRSPNTSMISNEKIIDGDVVSPKSRRESNISQQQINNTDQKPTSHRDSFVPEEQSSSRRESTALEQKPTSRKPSTASEQQPPSKRESIVSEQQTSSRRESTALEQKPASRKPSTASEQQPPSKRESIAPEQPISSRRESVTDEQKTASRKASTASEQQPPSKRESIAPKQPISSRRESVTDEQKTASRKASTASEQQPPSKRESIAPQQPISSRRESVTDEQKTASRKASTASEQQPPSKRSSIAPEQQLSSRRESHVSREQTSHRRQISFDQQEPKSSSKPVSRKTSIAEQQQQQIPSRRESQQQSSSSRRTSTNRDNQPLSPRRSNTVHISSSQESSRRNSITKQEQQSIPIVVNKDSRRSSVNNIDTNHQQIKQESYSSHKETPSSDTDDVPIRTATKHKQERTKSIDKRQKSSSTIDENDHRRSSFQRRSGQESKQNSNIITDETVVTPLIIDSSNARQHNGKRTSIKDYSYDQSSTSKLPPVNSSFQQEKLHLSETLNKQQIPISNRSEMKHLSTSSHSEDDQPEHWTQQIAIPSIHLTDDDIVSSSREDQLRPQSPNVEQIAERNEVPSPPLIITSKGKKRNAADGQKRKEQHRLSHRSTSADSITHIPLVDDKSLDSTSDMNPDFDRHKRRHIKPRKKDVETNTDQIFDSQLQQRSYFDEKELSPQKPLKATKPLSDHLYSTRRRAPHKEKFLTTPDTDTTTVRRTVKQTKDSNQDKDPVHVNVTVVVKKFSGTAKDGTSHTTTEAFVEQKSQQYFEPVQHPPEILPPSTTITENKEQSEELIERSKSTDQQRTKSSKEKILEHPDRHTQSDTEQIITDEQKKRRRPKRISRTCQTYESVFRRMEREQQSEMRATSDTEKNIQTRKSQLRPRNKSPKKNQPVYLTTDSFRLEDLLPKQYHQSRRNISKSSAITRSISPSNGKLLILRPTLPFHHTDAVNVHRVCLQYAIDLVPNEHLSSGTLPTHRNKLTVLKQPEQTNHLPMISALSASVNVPTNRSNIKEKSASNKSEDYIHQRKNGGAV